MSISELLVPEFDAEMKKTRTMLERIPAEKSGFAPHPKSTPLGKLASHVAQLAGFGVSKGSYKPLPFESAVHLVRVLDEGAAQVRNALVGLPDEAWQQNWKLIFQGSKILFDGSRFLAYRQMFLNHILHHRAQLGVYLRLNDAPVPATYGPSADDTLGF